MNIDEAAEKLNQHLRGNDWLMAVAVGGLDDKEVIFVYTKRTVKSRELVDLIANGWHGFEVKVQRIGQILPALN